MPTHDVFVLGFISCTRCSFSQRCRSFETFFMQNFVAAGFCHAETFCLLQGRPQLRLQKSYQFQVPKTNQKTSPLYLLVSIMTIFPFCYVDERGPVSKACNRGASRLGEAWDATRIGTRTKRGSRGLETI